MHLKKKENTFFGNKNVLNSVWGKLVTFCIFKWHETSIYLKKEKSIDEYALEKKNTRNK